jgi:hypothetical protein
VITIIPHQLKGGSQWGGDPSVISSSGNVHSKEADAAPSVPPHALPVDSDVGTKPSELNMECCGIATIDEPGPREHELPEFQGNGHEIEAHEDAGCTTPQRPDNNFADNPTEMDRST